MDTLIDAGSTAIVGTLLVWLITKFIPAQQNSFRQELAETRDYYERRETEMRVMYEKREAILQKEQETERKLFKDALDAIIKGLKNDG